VVVFGKHIKELQFFVVLMSDERAVTPDIGFYQRLVGDDVDGAVGYLEEWSREKNTDAYDGVLLPALAHVRRDRASGMISEEDEQRVVEAIAHTAESLGLPADASPERPDVLVIACPAMGRADEVELGILAQLVAADGGAVEVLPASLSTGEVLARVAASQPRAVVIGSVPPGGLSEARLLHKRLAAASSAHWSCWRGGAPMMRPAPTPAWRRRSNGASAGP
jgi:hypothetical protein